MLQQLISELPSRLAVDPKTMALGCALYGGRVARSVGRPRLAAELFTVVFAEQAETAYDYYVFEAGRGLEHMGAVAFKAKLESFHHTVPRMFPR